MGKYRDVAVASPDCAGGTTVALSVLVAHGGGAGEADWLSGVFCCFCTFLNLSCSRAAFLAAAASGPRDILDDAQSRKGLWRERVEVEDDVQVREMEDRAEEQD